MRSDKYLEEPQKNIQDTKSNNTHKKKIILIIFIFILIILFVYSRFICPNTLKINEYKIESELLDEKFNGFKIVHFSDIHYGTNIDEKKLDKIIKEINNLKPDIVVFTGDLIDKNIHLNDDTINTLKNKLKTIEARHYKYAVSGNEDNDSYYDILDSANFILLDNKEKLLFNDSISPIVIAGFTDSNENYDILNNEEYNGFYKIALVHKPDQAGSITNANLLLSGHSLGGLINIGTPLIKSTGAKKYYKEHYNLDNNDLYISYGLGTNKYNIRFNNKPSINLYRLYKK